MNEEEKNEPSWLWLCVAMPSWSDKPHRLSPSVLQNVDAWIPPSRCRQALLKIKFLPWQLLWFTFVSQLAPILSCWIGMARQVQVPLFAWLIWHSVRQMLAHMLWAPETPLDYSGLLAHILGCAHSWDDPILDTHAAPSTSWGDISCKCTPLVDRQFLIWWCTLNQCQREQKLHSWDLGSQNSCLCD